MRYDLTDFEWSVIEPVLPKRRRGPKPKKNRRVLNGIFWVLRTGAPWRDLPSRYGPYTTAYNRFNRWRKAGIWDRLMDAVTKAHNGNVQMIDSSMVRVHQHASGVKKRVEIVVWAEAEAGSRRRSMRASTPKGRPVRLLITPGQDHDVTCAEALLDGLERRAVVIADKGYDADRVRAHITRQGAIANIPNKTNRKTALPLARSRFIVSATCRALLQQAEAVQAHRHALRQTRSHLLRFHPTRRRANLAPIN